MINLSASVYCDFCRWFKDYSELDYARAGNEATCDVKIDAGIAAMLCAYYSNELIKVELPLCKI